MRMFSLEYCLLFVPKSHNHNLIYEFEPFSEFLSVFSPFMESDSIRR